MYYSNGNYEAFARPKKPEIVDDKSAYIVGSGLAALSTAVFLVRDAQMPGDHIHILEELSLPGGSMDGIKNDRLGYIIRSGREMEPHFEVLWDLFRSIPSLENPDHSILDEFYWLNKEDPCYAKTRVICNRGKALPNDGQLTLSEKAIKEMIDLILMPESKLENVQIDQVPDGVFIFLTPPDLDELKDRLVGRGTDSEEVSSYFVTSAFIGLKKAFNSSVYCLASSLIK